MTVVSRGLSSRRGRGAPLHRRLGLTDDELDAIRERLGRAPERSRARHVQRHVERALLVQELERPLLGRCPRPAADVLAGPGENAGVVRIGDGLAVAFKIESHNHPSAVEPYQGAATGVGGILRDIVAMGARPIALLDALKFGWPDDHRTRRLVDGVVRGVGGYGNCVGVPTVGGELTFDPTYTGNPLVNVMCVGIVAENGIARAIAPTPGALAVLYGSADGSRRDRWRVGPGQRRTSTRAPQRCGRACRSATRSRASCSSRRRLELVEHGLVEGMQDLGAAGLTCATSEVADRGGTGIRIDLSAVPRREAAWRRSRS